MSKTVLLSDWLIKYANSVAMDHFDFIRLYNAALQACGRGQLPSRVKYGRRFIKVETVEQWVEKYQRKKAKEAEQEYPDTSQGHGHLNMNAGDYEDIP